MYLLMVYPCIQFSSNGTIGYGYIAFQRFGRYKKCRQECSLVVNLYINTLLYGFRYVTSVSNFKSLRQLLMEILHFKDVGDTERHLADNAFVLVLGECQISIATYLRGIYPHIKLYCNVLGIDNVMPI